MDNENKSFEVLENEEVGRLLGGLKRVGAPKDFDFQVRARIAVGRPAAGGLSWMPASIRYAAPLAVLLAVGGYVGMMQMDQVDETVGPVIVAAPTEPALPPVVGMVDTDSTEPIVTSDLTADRVSAEVKPVQTVDRSTTAVQRKSSPARPKVEKPEGGSYDTAGTGQKTIVAPDIDDLAPIPTPKKVFISAKEFLSSAGIDAGSTATGGRIQSVGVSAASAGIRVGDVIESVDVQAGTIRIKRDGKSLTVKIN